MGADFVELDWVWDAQGQGWICHSMALEQHFPEKQGFLTNCPRKQSLTFVASWVNPY